MWNSQGINVLSCFDGMSCGQIALERAGITIENYYASEIDKYAIKVTQANYPNTIQLGDIRTVRAGMLPKIDLLMAGSPCQGFSFAGKQLAFDDDRSKLFFEFIRILKFCKPKYFLLENVVMSQQSNDVISSMLGELYPECVTQRDMFRPGRLEPIQINSALVSAQNRQRLYWTNIPDIQQPKDEGILLKNILECGSNTVNQRGRGNNPGGDKENKSPCMTSCRWEQNVKVRDKSQTIPATIYKENAKSMLTRKKMGLLVGVLAKKIKDENPRVAGVSITDDGLRPYKDDGHQGSLSEFGTISFPDSKAVTCTAAHSPKVVMLTERRTDEAKQIRRYNMKKGKDFSPRRAKELVPRKDDKANCLTTALTKEHILVKVPDTKQKKIAVGTIYWRKLTPVECERLQTVPDNYTNHVSNSQRYKMLGNGWTVNVIAHILESI
ncbi:DNA (cytosine-5-)-methyltransferase [Candidatus Pacearchaeota archaeon]|nr:DNA (cytosine-5-)-methyltransferase [Candidatus Pacearchaeota archaeon]